MKWSPPGSLCMNNQTRKLLFDVSESAIVRFRHRIIHGYDTVDDATVWGVIDRHLPQLLDKVESLLQDLENEIDGSA